MDFTTVCKTTMLITQAQTLPCFFRLTSKLGKNAKLVKKGTNTNLDDS